MSRASILIVVGVLAILAPFSGLPVSIRTLLAVVLGCVVIGIGVAERSREQHRLVALQGAQAPIRELAPAVAMTTPPAFDAAAAPSPAPRRSVAAAPQEPQPEIAIMMDIAPSTELQPPPPKPVAVRKPRARKAAPKTMSPI